jgi:DNA-binding CsgD family transcriptional regulator
MNESPPDPPVIWWICLDVSATVAHLRPGPGVGFRFLDLKTALQLLHRRRCPHFIFLESPPNRAAQIALTQLKEISPRLPVYLLNHWATAAEIQAGLSRAFIEMSQTRKPVGFAAPNMYKLSTRELEILRLMVKGLIKKEIGEQLTISYHTVDNHERNVFKKLNVHTRSAAVAKALIEKLC